MFEQSINMNMSELEFDVRTKSLIFILEPDGFQEKSSLSIMSASECVIFVVLYINCEFNAFVVMF